MYMKNFVYIPYKRSWTIIFYINLVFVGPEGSEMVDFYQLCIQLQGPLVKQIEAGVYNGA